MAQDQFVLFFQALGYRTRLHKRLSVHYHANNRSFTDTGEFMAAETPEDPGAAFREWVTEWERAVDKFSNQLMGTDEFSKMMNQMQNVQLEFQRNFGDLMGRQLANLNMPSREDVVKMSEDLQRLDRRIERIESSLRTLAENSQPNGEAAVKKRPPRTRKPPNKVED